MNRNRVPDENRVPVHFLDGYRLACGAPVHDGIRWTCDLLEATCGDCISIVLEEELSGHQPGESDSE